MLVIIKLPFLFCILVICSFISVLTLAYAKLDLVNPIFIHKQSKKKNGIKHFSFKNFKEIFCYKYILKECNFTDRFSISNNVPFEK